MPSRIVTSTYRYKRPPRKRKAVLLEVPAIVTKSARRGSTEGRWELAINNRRNRRSKLRSKIP